MILSYTFVIILLYFLETVVGALARVLRLFLLEMESETRVQILNEAVSLRPNAFEKGMNPLVLSHSSVVRWRKRTCNH